MEYLKIDFSDHRNIETELIISAFSKLKQVNIETCKINFTQLLSILSAIDRKVIKLERVSLFSTHDFIQNLPKDLILRLEKAPVAIDLRKGTLFPHYYNHLYTIKPAYLRMPLEQDSPDLFSYEVESFEKKKI